jgi:hypothetical protein
MTLSKSPLAKSDRNREIINRVIEGKGQLSLAAVGREYDLTRARIQAIVGDAGISMRQLKRAQYKAPRLTCGICGVSYLKGAYAEHCEQAGHRRLTPPGEKVERNQEIVRLYQDEQYNTTEIAESFGVPQPVITRILHRNGIRPEGRRPRKGGLPAYADRRPSLH